MTRQATTGAFCVSTIWICQAGETSLGKGSSDPAMPPNNTSKLIFRFMTFTFNRPWYRFPSRGGDMQDAQSCSMMTLAEESVRSQFGVQMLAKERIYPLPGIASDEAAVEVMELAGIQHERYQ